MIARILSRIKVWWTGNDPRIEAEYQEAQRIYLRCQARGDTRGKHDSWPRYRDAMGAKLKQEATIQNRGIGWRGLR